jgi:multidrug transporter EmrE-like cation transporter
MLKGLFAGAVNTALAATLGARWPGFSTLSAALLIGFLGYGVSLVLFVLALRFLGTARTGAYFSIAPFVGAVAAIVGFGERLTWPFAIGAACMAAGVWLHLTEHHEHMHVHEEMEHVHAHVHDEHHQHEHSPDDPPGEPHSHPHRHQHLVHSHRHYPDLHHRHRHD